jgi:hypothetical protein
MAIFTIPARQYASDINQSEAQVIEQIKNGELNGYENYGDWFVRVSDGVEKPIIKPVIRPEVLYRSRIGHSNTYQDQHGQKWVKVAGIYKKVDITYIPQKVAPTPKTPEIAEPPVAMPTTDFCIKCGKTVQQDIAKCPYCGAERPADSLSTTLFVFVFSVIIIAIVYFGIKWLFSGSTKPKKAQMPTATYAYFKCQNSVKPLLKSPSSANFGSIANTSIAQLKAGMRGKKHEIQYKVTGYVDAQNSFGAMIRNYYSCKVTGQTGNTWRLDDVALD